MEHLRYNASSEHEQDSKSQLFSYWMIGLALASVLLTLVYLFPGKSLVYTLLNQDDISEVDLYYSLLLRQTDDPIRFADIRAKPLEVIQNLEKQLNKNISLTDRWFNYIIIRAISYEPSLPASVKVKADQTMLQYLDVFKKSPISEQQMDQLARDALAINQPSYALFFYEKLLAKNPNKSGRFYASVGKIALWANQCVKSANYYFTTQHAATTLADKRFYYFQALKILFQCNQSKLAITLAEKHIDGLSDDLETYQNLIDLAIKGNQPATAQKYLIKFLQLKNTRPVSN